jgi:hypothetical protein
LRQHDVEYFVALTILHCKKKKKKKKKMLRHREL